MYGTVHFYLKIKNVQYCTLKNCGAYNVVLPKNNDNKAITIAAIYAPLDSDDKF